MKVKTSPPVSPMKEVFHSPDDTSNVDLPGVFAPSVLSSAAVPPGRAGEDESKTTTDGRLNQEEQQQPFTPQSGLMGVASKESKETSGTEDRSKFSPKARPPGSSSSRTAWGTPTTAQQDHKSAEQAGDREPPRASSPPNKSSSSPAGGPTKNAGAVNTVVLASTKAASSPGSSSSPVAKSTKGGATASSRVSFNDDLESTREDATATPTPQAAANVAGETTTSRRSESDRFISTNNVVQQPASTSTSMANTSTAGARIKSSATTTSSSINPASSAVPSRSTNLSSTAATGTRPSTLSSGAGIYQNPPPPSGASTAAAQIAVPQGSVEAATAAQAASRGKQAFSYDVGSMYLTLGILPTDSLISELEQFGVTQKNSSDSGVERSRDHVDARLDPNRFSQLTGKKLSAKEKFRRMFKSMAVSHADKLRKELFRLDLCLHRLTEMDEEAGESGLERWKSFLMGHKQLLDASGAASAPPAGANVSAPSSQLSINPRAQNEGGPPSNADSGMTHTSSTLQPLSSDQSRSSKNSNALRRRPADMSKLASSRLVPTATTSTNTGGNLTLNTMSTTSAGAGLNKMKNGGGVGGAPIFPATSSGTTSGANMIQEQYMKAKFEQMMEQQQQRSDLQISSQALRAGPATTSGASSSSASKELGPAMVMSPRGGGGPDGGGKGNDTPTATATAPPVSAALERIKRQSKSAPPGLDPGMMGLPVGGDSGSGDVAASPRDGGSSSSFMSQQLQQQFGFSTPTGMDDEGDNSDYFDVTGQHTPREQQEQHSMQQAQFGSPFFGPPPGGPGFDPNFDPAYYQQMMAAHHAHMQHMMQLYAANQQSAMSGDTSTTGVSYSFQPQPGAMQLPPPGAGGPPNPGDPNQYAAYLAAQQAYMVAMAGTTAGGANANINRNSGGKNRSSGPSASSTASGGQQIKTSSRRSQKNNKVQITASDSEKQSAEQQPTGAKGGAVGGGGKKQNK